MKNNDFDFIASKFEEENVKAPESLSAENVVKKFDEKSVNNIVKIKGNKRGVKSALALVACFAVVITSVAVGTKYLKAPVKPDVDNKVVQTSLDGIKYFSSYEELEKTLEELRPEDGGVIKRNFGVITERFSKSSDMAATDAESASSTGAAGKSFGTTNTQVENVDEADIIKNDGKYIYYLNDGEIKINSAENGKTELVSTIELSSKNNHYLKEMFVSGNKLIAIGTFNKEGEYDNFEMNTFVKIYDITDRKSPELFREYSQSGSYSTSRMYDGCVYIISNYSKYYFKKGFVPCVNYDAKGEEEIPIENICAVKDSKRTSYAVIGAVSLDGKSTKKNTKAVLGVSDNVYCNEKNLYLAGTDYDYGYYDGNDDYNKTQIIKYTFNKTNVELKASGEVKGAVNDQFSLDEKDGNLRIATTVTNYNDGKDKNYLFILNKKLEKIGEVTGFAKGEHIEAVRYIGDTAYVITFERTDPLFIIDLSNPKEPEIKGEVKIDGFSSSLTPVDENTLLGIGYSTMENEFGGIQTNGLKFVLFDISNPEKPKVLSEKTFKNCDSPAQYDHKAICINRDKGYFAVPYYAYNFYEDEEDDEEYVESDYSFTAVGVIRVNNGKIEFSDLDCGKEDEIIRCTYIDDYLYAVYSESGDILSFNVK